MRKRVLKSLWGLGAAVGLGLLASPAMASIDVTIDPEGDAAGAVLVSSLDWNVGNSLSQDGITAIQTLGTTDTYFQARLSVFNLAGGGTAQPATGEWTIVGGVTEQVVGVVGTTALFARAANPTVNFIEIWYDATPNADDLAGTGFNDGTLILSAEVNTLASNFTIFGGPTTLDGFQDDDWAGQQSVQGVGATSLTATVLSVDTAFFTDLMRDNAIELTLFNASQILPYSQVDPSKLFLGYAPVLGDVNGLDGPDFIFQADANQSFDLIAIPEPVTASLSLLGLGALGMAIRRRRA